MLGDSPMVMLTVQANLKSLSNLLPGSYPSSLRRGVFTSAPLLITHRRAIVMQCSAGAMLGV